LEREIWGLKETGVGTCLFSLFILEELSKLLESKLDLTLKTCLYQISLYLRKPTWTRPCFRLSRAWMRLHSRLSQPDFQKKLTH